jgi:hypothetical protein
VEKEDSRVTGDKQALFAACPGFSMTVSCARVLQNIYILTFLLHSVAFQASGNAGGWMHQPLHLCWQQALSAICAASRMLFN